MPIPAFKLRKTFRSIDYLQLRHPQSCLLYLTHCLYCLQFVRKLEPTHLRITFILQAPSLRPDPARSFAGFSGRSPGMIRSLETPARWPRRLSSKNSSTRGPRRSTDTAKINYSVAKECCR
ncbi:UNVERIFIED_CONTAM: hypothetical protein NCL1_39216 [Trichonephila clavipes]